jgi:hypothetical protein
MGVFFHVDLAVSVLMEAPQMGLEREEYGGAGKKMEKAIK